MRNTLMLARQELVHLLRSPLAWIILGLLLALSSWFFLNLIERFQQVAHELMNMPRTPGVTGFVIAPYFSNISLFCLMTVPILATYSIQRERWNQRLLLLESAPLHAYEIITGKFLGICIYLLLLTLLLSLPALCLRLGAPIDLSTWTMCFIGLYLLLCSFAALSLYLSLIHI